MYTVAMEKECACFKKSDYSKSHTFNTQQEAYQYANILCELMNEEFCGQHTFYAEPAEEVSFVIRVAINATFVSGCSTGVTCDVGCGSTDNWTLESADKERDESCGTGCGCS